MKNTKQQTAVEWLVEELQKADWIPKDSLIMDYVIKQAKEMEKQQITEAYIAGYSAHENLVDSEKYYKETFKNNNYGNY